ncbi:MAG: SpoIID/LytB domain-containing protein, partial [Clostridia bacterium]|nr:SpoIID/LytB domain-containing protein [Clostridia bacterium]
RKNSAYDVVDGTNDQTFKGYNSSATYANVVSAVNATKGGVLYYNGSLANLYYSASNGGQTESAANVWGGKLAYSIVKDDLYDLASRGTKKSATIKKDGSNLDARLKEALVTAIGKSLEKAGHTDTISSISLESIDNIIPSNPKYAEPSRVFRSLTFEMTVTANLTSGEKQTGTVKAVVPTFGGFEDWYSMSINSSDNETVYVDESEKEFRITFRRNGHGVGMSQRGAQIMAADHGKTCGEILEFYYPGTTPKQLSLTDTTKDTAAKPENTPVPEKPAGDVLATAKLNAKTDLYAKAEAAADIIGTLAADSNVDIYGIKEGWAAVGCGEKYGYIVTDSLTSFAFVNQTVVRPEEDAFAHLIEDASLMQLPFDTARVLGGIKKDAKVQVLACSGGWALVDAGENTHGYLKVGVLKAIEMPEEENKEDNKEEITQQKPAAVVAPDNLYGRLKEKAYLYSSRNTDGQVRETLKKDSLVKVVAYNDTWAFVTTPSGDQGYVLLTYLKPVRISASAAPEASSPTPEPAPESTPTPSPEPENPDDGGGKVTKVSGTNYVWITAENANMYARNSALSPILDTLPSGTKVRIGAYNDVWACIKHDGMTGFVRLGEISAEKPGDESAEDSVVKVSGVQYRYVNTMNTPLYKSASTSSGRYTSLVKGAKVRIGAYNSTWACVKYDGMTGYVKLSALNADKPTEETEEYGLITYEECIAITVRNLNLYKKPDASSTIKASVPKGFKVDVYAYNEECAYVKVDGKYGFVALEHLKKIA